MKKPLILMILDGFGISLNEGNAIVTAKTPNIGKIFGENPITKIGASGMDVGLPDGQMGNSEVGHTNIGAGIDGNPVTSYEQLTTAQKKLLLNSCMLNNAYVMEMLSNTSGGGKNLCLRQTSSAAVLDSVRFWNWSDLPENLNVGEVDAEGNNTGDKRFWDPYRKQARGGMYMVMDKTVPMMTHFLEGQMKEKNIKHSDIGFIVGDNNYPETENRSYIYGSRVLQQDIVCLNGYIHTVDKVILTPDNMAEMIRKNGTEEAFEGYRAMRNLGCPFLLISDARLGALGLKENPSWVKAVSASGCVMRFSRI